MKTLRDCKTEQDVFDYFVENWADCDIGEGALQDAFDKGLAGEEVTDEEVEEIAEDYGWGNADDYYIGMNEIGLEIKKIGLKAYIEENAMDEDDDWDDEEEEDEEWDEDEDFEEGFDFGDEDTTIYEVECACGNIIDFDEETLEEGSIICPNCGETLEFSIEDDEDEE